MKVLLFDIDGTLIRAGGAGRKALNRAAYVLYGKKHACSELSLAGRTDLYNFGAAYQAATGKKPTRAAVERLHREYLKHLPYYVKMAIRNGTYHVPAGLKTLLKRLARDRRVLLGLKEGQIDAKTLKYALNTAKRVGAHLHILYVAAVKERENTADPLLEQFEAELRMEGIPHRIVQRTGCLKQQIIDYTNSEKEILFAVIESPNSLDADCNKKDKALSELWRKLKCPLVVVMDGARA